ncbi:MAG: hypothetical protein ACLTA1_02990, partial [Clostridia bacterium]
GASFLDPKTGQPLKKGTKAVIKTKTGGYYREFALFVHDFALLFDKDNQPLNPPEHPGSDDDPGVMGVNYRAEPMRERLKIQEDPSHIFSSIVYGDPATPVLETYPGDPMVIRLLDGAHEEPHAFDSAGMSWRKLPIRAPPRTRTNHRYSEAFNIRIDGAYGAGVIYTTMEASMIYGLVFGGLSGPTGKSRTTYCHSAQTKRSWFLQPRPPKMRESATSKSPQFKNSSSTIDTETMIQKASCSSPWRKHRMFYPAGGTPVLLFYGQMQAIGSR